MRLANGMLGGIAPKVPESLEGRITVVSETALSVRECEAFSAAFCCLESYLSKFGDPFPNAFATAVFVSNDSFMYSMSPNEAGSYSPLIVYPLHVLMADGYVGFRLLGVALEELCHCFFMERDEAKVKVRVLEVARSLYPTVQLTDLFPPALLRHYGVLPNHP